MTRATLFGHPVSLYTRKARLALLLQGVPHDYEIVAPHADHPGFKAASPIGKIPAFSDGHASFADSSVIAHYVNRYYDGNRLMPETPDAYARALWFESYADTVMAPVIGGHLFAEMVLAERLFRRAPMQSDIDKAVNQELPALYALLDRELQGRQWLVGDAVTIGDVAVGGALIALHHCHQTIPATAPNLADYTERFFALDQVRQVIAEEVRVLKAMQYDTPLAARV